jgi:hypothetical protein
MVKLRQGLKSFMNTEKLERDLKLLVANLNKTTFIYDLLSAYGQPKASITRLQKGDYNLATFSGDILWKKKLYFRAEEYADLHVLEEEQVDLHDLIDTVQKDHAIIKHHPRFMIVTDFETLLAVDTKTNDTLDIPFKKLPKHYDFFLPWAGMEKAQYQSENPADIKAAERMGRLYDIIRQDNPDPSDESQHALNLFLSRLLFCFFAEDTGIFEDGQFTNALASHTATDGSDLQTYLQRLFRVLNSRDRSSYPQFLQDFPYVNGGLFADDSPIPHFSATARKIIIESGSLNWKQINPDIFGSMMQAVIHDDQRGSLGMHYTSVVNIMKVIQPLFLDELYETLERAGSSKKKLESLLDRLQRLRIFDPACGSGNFLIIVFKELCRLEIEILKRMHSRPHQEELPLGFIKEVTQLSFQFIHSRIKLTQFYGIEIDDFAHETAKLSLWLAKHQMNLAFKEVFGAARPTLPLQDGGNIVCGNATRLDWEEVCPKDAGYEIYILGNPPYLGARNQSKEQKADMAYVFDGHKDYKDSDYISCWFLKGLDYINKANAIFAFVSTNSISQGEQVGYLWPRILERAEICFAYQSFKWTNNAKGNAGVTCIIVGIRNKSNKPKFIFSSGTSRIAKNISPYLHDGKNTIAYRTRRPISQRPKMVMGNMARDGGNLILSTEDASNMKLNYPKSSTFIRKLYGSHEFLNSGLRWCLWISDNDLELAKSIEPINERIANVYKFRIASKAKTTQQYSLIPHKFAQRSYIPGISIIVPRVSSERREYIPFGFLDDGSIISDSAQAIHNAEPYIFAVISSRMHMTWVRAVAGRLKTDYRYSSTLCYNTFPFPNISEAQKETLEEHVFAMLDAREQHPEKTMAQLYDPDKMPANLRQAHHEMDLAMEHCYRKQPFKSDEERLEYLFARYEKMIEAEKKQE